MFRVASCVTALCLPVLFVACSDANVPSAPRVSNPSASVVGGSERVVTMTDACDPTTFNEAVEPGTCVRNGGVTFDKFVEELTKHAEIGAWHFAPATMTAEKGQTIVAFNRGGEVHTFTEVAEFGGGVVGFLNDLAKTPNVAKECPKLEDDDFVAPGTTYREELDEAGVHKFQCCIHPWMRATVTVR
jgi:plastocyanin